MSLTSEQLALLQKIELGSYSFSSLSTEEQSLLSSILRPNGPFTSLQRDLLHDWYLPVTSGQLAAANAALPKGIAISGRADSEGVLWVNADLLTDCAQPGDTYNAIGGLLIALPLTKKPDSDFPSADFEI